MVVRDAEEGQDVPDDARQGMDGAPAVGLREEEGVSPQGRDGRVTDLHGLASSRAPHEDSRRRDGTRARFVPFAPAARLRD